MSTDKTTPRQTMPPQSDWRDGDLADASCLPHPAVTAVALSAEAVKLLPRHVLAPDATVTLRALSEVTRDDLIGSAAPDLIVAPLVSRGFDATDLLTLLRETGFQGRFLVLAPRMPDIPLIRAEMLMQAPDLNVDIIALDGNSVLHLL